MAAGGASRGAVIPSSGADLSRRRPAMTRMQLFELEDMPWLPDSLRDAGTDFLRTLMALAKPYA